MKSTKIVLTVLCALPLATQAGTYRYGRSLAPGAGEVSIQQDGNRLVMDFSAFHFEAQNTKAGSFERLKMQGAGVTSQIGTPELPVFRRLVAVNSDNVQLEIVRLESNSVAMDEAGLNALPLPVQAPVEKKPGAFERAAFVLNQKIYQSKDFFPNTFARIANVGSERGQHFAMVEVMPLRWNPATQRIEYLEHLELRLNSGSAPLRSTSIDEMAMPGEGNPAQEKFLVIVGRGFENNAQVQRLVVSKQARGFEMVVTNVQTIGTTAPQVREYIRNLYTASTQTGQRPLTYVLLVGDVETLPVYNAGAHVTDNYYAAVDQADYNADRTYPDLGIGRLAVKTAAELEVVVNKIVRYEANQFTDRAWTKKAAFLATNDRYTVAEGSHNYVIDTYTRNLGYTGLFPQVANAGGDKIYAITHRAGNAEVMRAVNDGRAIVSYSGHGATTFWDAPRMTQQDVMSISHTEALPYAMSHACISGSFAMPSGDSFGETWLKAARGAIAFWGASNSSYWDEDDILEKTFFDGFFRDGIQTLGYLNKNALQGVRTHYGDTARNSIYYYEIYNLLGDPSVSLVRQ